jgi:hypothetical protein
MMRARSLALAALCAASSACSSGPQTASVPTASAVPTAAPTVDPPPRTGVFVSKRFGMKLSLPGGSVWKIDDTRASWLVAKRADDDSTLLVKLWRDENRMTPDKCEERARASRALPSREGADVLEQRTLDVPPGLGTHADVALVADPSGKGLYGMILAFGGWSRRCFAYVYVTHAEGPGADAVVGDRLAAMTETSLRTLEFESDLDVVLERDAPVDAPPEAPAKPE